MSSPWFLELLELPAHADERAVRRAYAARVKLIDPATDPAGFARLREAYEAARAWTADERSTGVVVPPPPATMPPAVVTAPCSTGVVVPPSPTTILPAVVTDPVAEPPVPPPVIALDDVTAGPPEPPPTPVSLSPHEQALRLADRFAARITHGSERDIQRELDACSSELRLQYIDAPGMFEEAIVDRLARGTIGKRAAVFAIATDHFHWQELGHLAALGPRGAWIETVESQRMAWGKLPPLSRATLLSTIERAAASGSPLPVELIARWREVRDVFQRYPGYMTLHLDTAAQNEWRSRYDALPLGTRRRLENPVEKRRLFSRLGEVPVLAWVAIVLTTLMGLTSLIHPSDTGQRQANMASSATSFPSSPTSNLRVTLGKSYEPDKQGGGWIVVTLKNTGDSTLYLTRQLTPPIVGGDRLQRPIFDVADQNGRPASFTGTIVNTESKYPETFYLRLNPRQSVSLTFDLGVSYTLQPGSLYTVSYRQAVTSYYSLDEDGTIHDNNDYVGSNAITLRMDTPAAP